MSTKRNQPPNFRKELEHVSHRHDTRRVFDAFCKFAACALSGQTREEEYHEELKRWEPSEVEGFARALGALVMEMQEHPFEDMIGTFYMEFALSQKGQQWHGEFHTPKNICDLMARMTLGANEMPEEGPITVCEPACGSGAMILSVAQETKPEDRRRLRVTAIDINRTACDMCFINTTLWGIPARILNGNTISMEMWHQWTNIHWRMPWLPLAMRPAVQPQGEAPPVEFVKQLSVSLGQQELQFA